jgi:hypothetical protein
MVRFLEDASAADADALRSARGNHDIYMEDGNQGLALQARCPWLKSGDDGGVLTLPYSEFADFTLRYMRRESGSVRAFQGSNFQAPGSPTPAAPLSG